MHMSSQRDPTSDNDEQDDNQLNDTEQVLQSKTPFHRERMDEECSGETGQPDTALVPATNLDIGGVEDVFTENDTVAGGPAQQDGVGGVHGGSEEFGLLEDVFEVVLFTTVPIPC